MKFEEAMTPTCDPRFHPKEYGSDSTESPIKTTPEVTSAGAKTEGVKV